jgi:hypothetical protein
VIDDGRRKEDGLTPMRDALASPILRWRSWRNPDLSLAALLVLLILYILVFIPLYGTPFGGSGMIGIAFSMILLAGVLATSDRRTVRFWMIIVAVLAFSSHWLHIALGGHWIRVVDLVFACLFFCIQGYFTLRRVFGAGEVNAYRILGAIAGYLIIGLVFANAYILLEVLSPGAFRYESAPGAAPEPLPALLYFSFVTLTTVGYGDITVLNPAGRSLAMVEALVGQLYPAILIGRLVTLYRRDGTT